MKTKKRARLFLKYGSIHTLFKIIHCLYCVVTFIMYIGTTINVEPNELFFYFHIHDIAMR